MESQTSQKKPFWRGDGSDSEKRRFSFTAPREACVGPPDRQFFMGGAGMATLIDALERGMGKPLIWATAHFLHHGMLGERFEIELEERSGGRNVMQAEAVMRRGETVSQRVIAALGRREGASDRQFIAMPRVAPPEACPPKKDDIFAQPDNLLALFSRRTALEENEAGLEYMWIRPLFPFAITAPLLALTSDFFLGAHKESRGGTSLDNTLRICALEETDWILCATQIASFTNGAIHGTQYQFARNGTLLAASSQSGLLPRAPLNQKRV